MAETLSAHVRYIAGIVGQSGRRIVSVIIARLGIANGNMDSLVVRCMKRLREGVNYIIPENNACIPCGDG
jgi:hypothetical protein